MGVKDNPCYTCLPHSIVVVVDGLALRSLDHSRTRTMVP